MKKRLSPLIRYLLVAAVAASWPAGIAVGQQKVLLAVPAYSASFTPFFIAAEKGYWSELGLDVEIIRMKSALTVKAAIGGGIHFPAAAGSAVAARVRGAKMKVLFAASNKAMFSFMVNPAVKTAGDLKGKVIAVSSAGGLIDVVTRIWLAQNGIQGDKDVTIMVVGPPHLMLAALKTRKIVQAAMLSTPHALIAHDAGFNTLAFAGDSIRTITGGAAATAKLVRKQPKMVSNFIYGTIKGLIAFRDNRELAVDVLLKRTKLKGRKMAYRTWDYYQAGLSRDGTISTALMKEMIEREKKRAKVTRDISVSEVFDFSITRRATEKIRASGWKP